MVLDRSEDYDALSIPAFSTRESAFTSQIGCSRFSQGCSDSMASFSRSRRQIRSSALRFIDQLQDLSTMYPCWLAITYGLSRILLGTRSLNMSFAFV